MPLLRKQAFVKEKPPANLKPDDEVFQCKITNEIFTDYEKFFERIILCNSLVWTCSITGRPGLTYQEAVECEIKARKHIATFPDYLQKPILFLASRTSRTRIHDMNDDVFLFAKDRYFVNEVVEVQHDDEKKMCKVVKVIAPSQGKKLFENGSDKDSDVIVLDSTDDSDEEDDKPLSSLKNETDYSESSLEEMESVVDMEFVNKDEKPISSFGPDSDKYQYVVQEMKEPNIYIVAAKQVSRKKGLYTRDKSKLYLKTHCNTDKENVWSVRERYIKKFGIKEVNWSDHFDGPLPSFAVTKGKNRKSSSNKSSNKSSQVIDLTDEDEMIKKAKKQRKEMKKLEKEMKKIKKEHRKVEKKQKKKEMKMKEKEQKQREEKEKIVQQKKEETLQDKLNKMSPEERAEFREKLRMEKLAEKLAQKEELKKAWEEEKLKRKEERDKEREKKKEEKRIKEEHLKEWNKAREDMECDDLKPLPKATPIQCSVPNELFGDAMMIVEYLTCFKTLFDLDDEFPDGVTIDFLGRAIQETDVNGAFCDLIRFLLTSLFQLQEEEEEYDEDQDIEEDLKVEGLEHKDVSFKELVKQATISAQIPQQNYGTPLNKMSMDGFTITEILRLHFLSSGARASESNNRFRYQQRGGYTEYDDAGLEFKRNETAILKTLSEVNVFDLTAAEKLKVLVALIQQLLTYVTCRDAIEESQEQLKHNKMDLKMHQWAEQRREKEEATFWYKKRIDERNKEKEQKKKEKEDQLKNDENKDNEEKKNDETGEQENEEPSPSGSKQNTPEDKKKGKVKGRQSARQKEKELNDGKELPVDNIDWEKLSPEDKELMREKFELKELELMQTVEELVHSSAIHPLGRDRTFRRYWVFSSIPGVFVEDQDEHIPKDFLQPVPQTLQISNLPLKQEKSEDKLGEEKSTSSDKENDSFDHGKGQGESNTDQKGNILQENKQTIMSSSVTDEKVSDMETDEKPVEQIFESVHEQIENRNKCCWAFYSTPLQLDSLINHLNPRGYREGPLRQALTEQKRTIVESLGECPVDVLNISEEASTEGNVRFHQIKSRNRKIQGQVKGASASEFMELNLREQLLDFEERVFVGGLGSLKVNERKMWKDALEFGNYDPQCDELKWSDQSLSVHARMSKIKPNGDADTSMSQESEEGEASLVVRDLSCALLQLQQMVEPKFLKPPLGEDEVTKKEKIKEALELAFKGLTPRKIKAKVWEKDSKKKKKEDTAKNEDSEESGDEEDNESEATVKKSPLERWQESLMSCTSLSQVFLHSNVLENSITWDKSALNARCKICRRKGDDEKMLLCDGCDYGYHMYCLKPPMKKLPVGDWYCQACKPKEVAATPRKRRKSTIVEEEEEEIQADSDSDDSSEGSDDDSDEDSDDEDSDDNSDEESEEEEVENQPTKIKFLKGFKGRPAKVDSEVNSSRGGSAKSSRSNTPTPQGKGKGKGRASLEKAMQLKAVAGKGAADKRKASRHSIETSQPSRKSSRRSVEEKPTKAPSRLSLESNTRGKRKLIEEDEEEESPKKQSKSRGNEKVNVMKMCEDLVNELTKRDESWPFLRPVTKKEAPDYFDIVKSPMDFATIRNKINNVMYSHPTLLIEDVRSICKNCHAYNMPTAPEYQAASKLSKYFEKKCKELKLDMLIKNIPASPTKTPPKASKSSPVTGRRTTRRK